MVAAACYRILDFLFRFAANEVKKSGHESSCC
jgi:hypothetical protein